MTKELPALEELGELLTVTQNRLPIKMVVFNNSSLNFVELEMKAAGFVTYGTDLVNPDFAAVANAMGIKGIRVSRNRRSQGMRSGMPLATGVQRSSMSSPSATS